MSIIEMAENFAESAAEWVKNGAPVVSKAEFKQRADICSACEFFDPKAFAGKGRCTQCGCSSFKLFLATARCPIGKWERVDGD